MRFDLCLRQHSLIPSDPYKDGALALYNTFDDNRAVFFDSAGGHTIPRAGKLLHELAQSVRDLIANVREEYPAPSVRPVQRLDSAVEIPSLNSLKLTTE